MIELPKIMVAPNGARRTKLDHPEIPVTIPELVETARTCLRAGATAMHAHLRDENQKHILDAELYRELIAEMSVSVPEMGVQITTESVGQYSAQQQRKLVSDIQPGMVSVALNEMLSDGDEKASTRFYLDALEAETVVQHILYSADEFSQFISLANAGFFGICKHQLLFVLGKYTKGQQSNPSDLNAFLHLMREHSFVADWAVCAFGVNETICSQHALELGGKVRVGFENSIWNKDGSIAANNAERVEEVFGL